MERELTNGANSLRGLISSPNQSVHKYFAKHFPRSNFFILYMLRFSLSLKKCEKVVSRLRFRFALNETLLLNVRESGLAFVIDCIGVAPEVGAEGATAPRRGTSSGNFR